MLLDIQISKLCLGKKILLEKLDWQCHDGQIWCLAGMNGIGKTTLLHTIAGFNTSHTNQIKINQQPLTKFSAKERARYIGVLFQDQTPHPYITVEDALLTAAYSHQNIWSKKKLSLDLFNLLEELEIPELFHKQIYELSGGEHQRLHIAMLLAQNPQIYLLDEPTNHLDLKYQHTALNILKRIAQEQNRLIITTLHDMNLAASFADHACFIYPDKLIELGTNEEIFTAEKLTKLLQCKIEKIPYGQKYIFHTIA